MTGVAQTTADSNWLYCRGHHAQRLCFKLSFSHSDLPSAVTLHAAICTVRQLQLDVRHAVGSKVFYAGKLPTDCMHSMTTASRHEKCNG